MRVNRLYGLRTLMARGPRIGRSDDKPEGLLAHEPLLWSLFPMHLGIRQYWRDLPALLTWARSEPHRLWWRDFLRDSGGTAFWHETYLLRGGMEAVYDDIPQRRGFASFAPVHPARSAMFGSAARRTTSPRSSPRTTSTPPGPGSRFCAQCYGRSRLLAVACADERMLAGRSAPRGVMR